MRAVVLREPGSVSVEDVQLDPPKAHEVLVRVAAAGVCHSDVRLADGELGDGRWPMVLGHEGAGVVEAVGTAVEDLAPGDHVAFSFVPACRVCRACRSGRPNLCEPAGVNGFAGMLMDGTSRLHRDGETLQHGLMTACFAERTVLAAASAIKIPKELPLQEAALLGCGVVTGIGAVRNVAHVQAGESVCVIGCGGVGLQVIAGARLAGAAPIVAVDRSTEKLERALVLGATHAVDSSAEDAVAAVRGLTDGGADHAFEVVGRPETIRLAWDLIRAGGQAIVVGLVPRGVDVSVPGIEFLSDKSLLGTYYGSGDAARDLPALAELALAGELDLAGVVTHTTDLDGVPEALDRLRRGEGARTVVIVDSDSAGGTP
ncbi:MAG: S-(hydroxymethyl)glutathione dehydrogenase / alcohol dehydrogenase [Gaiellaceae bacterium]|jgi:Zn-dependent alcohol dehydrogenase|nr:S-(hydroxymethyl)glutathione dehydrogenase / alcohol dehydrogenase [Gaiellaceae bacterium]